MCFTGCRSRRELSSRSLCWLLTLFGAWGMMGPTYFTRVCVPVSDNTARSSLRSVQRGDLLVPRTRMKLRTRSFRVSAPTAWNSLPTKLRSTSISRDTFKSRLKSHFYADAYLHQVWERSRLRQTMTLTMTLTLGCITWMVLAWYPTAIQNCELISGRSTVALRRKKVHALTSGTSGVARVWRYGGLRGLWDGRPQRGLRGPEAEPRWGCGEMRWAGPETRDDIHNNLLLTIVVINVREKI